MPCSLHKFKFIFRSTNCNRNSISHILLPSKIKSHGHPIYSHRRAHFHFIPRTIHSSTKFNNDVLRCPNQANYVKGGGTLRRESSREKEAREKSARASLPPPPRRWLLMDERFDDCLRIRHAIVRAAIISLRKKTSALLLVYYGF